ncbi:hypothetical protein AX15_001684 [Amanita polypyramis BW_CC]|nr:hypothetical protein AX15_001684 [Amanita polypyramis BW_CC]
MFLQGVGVGYCTCPAIILSQSPLTLIRVCLDSISAYPIGYATPPPHERRDRISSREPFPIDSPTVQDKEAATNIIRNIQKTFYNRKVITIAFLDCREMGRL